MGVILLKRSVCLTIKIIIIDQIYIALFGVLKDCRIRGGLFVVSW